MSSSQSRELIRIGFLIEIVKNYRIIV